jgi:hypothetical protein
VINNVYTFSKNIIYLDMFREWINQNPFQINLMSDGKSVQILYDSETVKKLNFCLSILGRNWRKEDRLRGRGRKT